MSSEHPLAGVAKTASDLAAAAVEVAKEPWPIAVLKGLVTIAASPGGLAILERIFVDHGLAPEKVDEAIRREVRF